MKAYDKNGNLIEDNFSNSDYSGEAIIDNETLNETITPDEKVEEPEYTEAEHIDEEEVKEDGGGDGDWNNPFANLDDEDEEEEEGENLEDEGAEIGEEDGEPELISLFDIDLAPVLMELIDELLPLIIAMIVRMSTKRDDIDQRDFKATNKQRKTIEHCLSQLLIMVKMPKTHPAWGLVISLLTVYLTQTGKWFVKTGFDFGEKEKKYTVKEFEEMAQEQLKNKRRK